MSELHPPRANVWNYALPLAYLVLLAGIAAALALALGMVP